MTKWLLFDRWTVLFIAIGVWVLLGLPFWWFARAFGAPLLPLPAPTDVFSILFLLSFYVPLVVMAGIGLASARAWLANRKTHA